MAKGRPYEAIEEELKLPPAAPPGFGDLCLISLPVVTFQALANEAAKRGLTLAQLLQKAIDGVLAQDPVPQLLVDQRGKR